MFPPGDFREPRTYNFKCKLWRIIAFFLGDICKCYNIDVFPGFQAFFFQKTK